MNFHKSYRLAVLFILIAVTSLTGTWCNNKQETPSGELPKEQYASLDPLNGYVGMESCKNCHQSIYETFIQTGMGKSFDIASRKKSSGNFHDQQPVYDKHHNFYYLPFWDGDSLKIKEYRLEGTDTIYKRVETVNYIVGSGQHTNSHIMNTFGYLNQMPLTFYTQKGQWDMPPGFENGGNSRFSRIIGLECMSCHNAYPEFITGSENRYDFVATGINCERCHGPGEKHVKDKLAGKIVDAVTGIDYSIVNPAKLPIDLQLDVCQRCHIQGNAVLKDSMSFFDFKPGMHLSDVMDVYMPVYKGRENEHIMASHVERMKLSKCFTGSLEKVSGIKNPGLRPYKNALTCVTCHNPHVSVRKTDLNHFNNACKTCHSPETNPECSENEKILVKNEFNCVSCHMPFSGATDIPHVSVHDHYIRIPDKENNVDEIKEFIGINCLNNPAATATSKGRAFINYFEKFNYGKEVLDSARKYIPSSSRKDKINHFADLIHICFLEKNYNEIIAMAKLQPESYYHSFRQSISNTDAWTAYRIGQAYTETGDVKNQLFFYGIAYKLAASIPEFANKYASALVYANEAEEARKILKRSVANYSKYPPTLSNLGFLVLQLDGNKKKAAEYYDRALALDPDYAQAVINKAGLFISDGNFEGARALLEKFARQNPGNQTIEELLLKLRAS